MGLYLIRSRDEDDADQEDEDYGKAQEMSKTFFQKYIVPLMILMYIAFVIAITVDDKMNELHDVEGLQDYRPVLDN